MKCPFCKNADTQVVDSRANDEADSIRRRRRCPACDKRFTTYENIELRMPQVVKSNGSREEFEEDKLRVGFTRALHKRPVSAEMVEEAIERVKHKLLSLGEREVETRRIGEMVIRELYKLDKVAYIRFASVYRDFQDVEDFREAVREVQKPAVRRKSR
ncbi:MAG: transcriptional regulator NrdR [Burkholderiales bacterium]|jgi:transcriptional repressor NrdR